MASTVRSFNHLAKLGGGGWSKMDAVIRQTARDIRDTASALAPVDTSALQHSLYVSAVSNVGSSDYMERAAEAESLRHSGNRPDSPAEIVPEILPDKLHEAVIGSAVAHALVNEFGGVTMPARPFLVPAVEYHAEEFFDKVLETLLWVDDQSL